MPQNAPTGDGGGDMPAATSIGQRASDQDAA
jgi:hypothetical protein